MNTTKKDRYQYQYKHKGSLWAFKLFAESREDAEERLQSIKATGQLNGQIHEQGTICLSGMDRFLNDMKQECGMND